MIKEKYIEIKGHPSNLKYYRNLGYEPINRKPFKVKVEDLMKGSGVKITTICDNCGDEKKNVFKDYYNYTNGLTNSYYCTSCKNIKSEKTNLEKYGVKNSMLLEETKDKIRKTNLEKYGVDWYSKTDDYKEKFAKTSNEKWGVDNPSKSKEIKDKIKKTNLEKYGVNWIFQSEDMIKKSKETNLEKYGVDWYSKTNDYKVKIIKTCNEKYGTDNVSQSDIIKERVRLTNLERWGGHPSKTEWFKSNIKNQRERKTYKRYKQMISDKYDFISYKNEKFTLRHKECGKEFVIQKGLLYARFKINKTICTECNPVGLYISEFEYEISKFIKTLGLNIKRNDKKILGGKELDILIEDKKIAIEANGLYWHSEFFKESKYHLNKTKLCSEKNISLLHIWEDDWYDKNEIVKSIIKNRLGKSDNRIYARKCEIRNVGIEYKKFLNDNHIQGYASSTYKLGLYYNDELVSLMTFGYRMTNSKKEMELIRFCNKLNTTVIGSASKLFKYFINNYDFDYIVSYADISIFSGELYKKLGFKSEGLSEPNYFWVVDGKRKHRYNYSKRKLVNAGYDSTSTESEIMHSLGYYRIYSTGQERWVYQKIQ
jgi:hypothetical protein